MIYMIFLVYIKNFSSRCFFRKRKKGFWKSLLFKRILLNNLETDNLGIQYFIGKQEVADILITEIFSVNWR